VARRLGLPAGVALSATLRAWASAYGEEHDVDREEHSGPQCAAAVTTQSLVSTPVPDESPGLESPTDPTLMVLSQVGVPAAIEDSRASVFQASHREPPSGPVRDARPARVLRGAIWLTAAALVAVSGALATVQGGVFGHSGGYRVSASTSLSTSAVPQSRARLLTALSASADQASYSVTASTYRVTISANRPSWVELSPSGGSPVFAGIVEPGAVSSFIESRSVRVQVGAGGTSIAVSEGDRSLTLMAPVAPYTYLLSPG